MSRAPSIRLPRRLHAGAWWVWAIGMGAAAASTTNPLVLGLIVAVTALVVSARRSDASWARGFRIYLLLALVVVGIRIAFRIVLGGDLGTHVAFRLPAVPLPSWAVGVDLGGPVTVETILAGLYDGLRLATMLVCVGAANSLADPRRLLTSLPAALRDVAASVAVAISLAPQLVESVERVRRARRLRGTSGGGIRSVRSLLVPVLQETLDRSLALAASMAARGYGRAGRVESRRPAAALVVGGTAALGAAGFGLLTGAGSTVLMAALALAGMAACVRGLVWRGRAVDRTRYRPDPWRGPEWLVAAAGFVCAAGVGIAVALTPDVMAPSLQPLTWPSFSPVATLAVLAAAAPALAAPPVRLRASVPSPEGAPT